MLELTTVGLIIMILIAIALPNFLEAQVRARVTAAYTDNGLVAQAIEEYYIEHRAYPPNRVGILENGGLAGDGEPWVRGTALEALTTPVPFLSRLPYDQFDRRQDVPQIFDYVNLLDPSGKRISAHSMSGQGSCVYVVAGLAPDKIPQIKAGEIPPTAIPYSPTNGTVSFGDQVLLGP